MGQAGRMPAIHRERALVKLTRSLRLTGRRPDGYHLIESEMVTLDFGDELEIEPLDTRWATSPSAAARDSAPSRAGLRRRYGERTTLEVVDEVAWVGEGDGFVVAVSGETGVAAVPGPPATGPQVSVPTGADNLVVRALELAGRSARVRLVKRVPPGAGLGGGSADAAAVLRWAGVTSPGIAARLGADVPFCVAGGRALVSGIGEQIEVLEPDDVTYLCCTPSFGVPTALVYRAFDELDPPEGPGSGQEEAVNDLERAAIVVEPRLAVVRDLVASVTGARPVLAGSGSTWYVACDPADGTRLRSELAAAVVAEHGRATLTLGRTVGAFAL